MRAERAFRSPQLFRRNRPKIPCTWPDNPTHAASFSRQFPARTARRPPRLGQKRGLFAPPAPASPAFCPPERPVLPRRRPFFARRAPGWRPGLPRFCPGPRRPRTPLGPRKLPRVQLFFPPAPASAHRAPPERPKVAPPPKPPRRAPPARPLPPPAAPAEAQPWGWQPRLPRSAFPLRREEVCDP